MENPNDPSAPQGAGPDGVSAQDALFTEAKKLGWRVGGPALVAAVLPGLMGFVFIGSATSLQQWVQSHGTAGMWVFAAFFALTTGLALMPTYALSFGAGVFFGWRVGGGLAVASILTGALIGYAMWGAVARARVMQVIDANPKASVVRNALVDRSVGRTLLMVTLLRVPPNSPFALMNMVMSSVKVNPLIYLIGTGFGMAPRTILAAFIGATAGSLSEIKAAGGPWKLAGIIAGIAIALFVIWLASKWSRQAIAAELNRDPAPSPRV